MPGRHVPERTCVACRAQQPKRALIRIVRSASGQVAIDPTGKASGRGAYLCPRRNCWQTGLRKDVLVRALKTVLAPQDRVALEAFAAGLDNQQSEEARQVAAEGSTR